MNNVKNISLLVLFLLWQWYWAMPTLKFGFTALPFILIFAGILLVLINLKKSEKKWNIYSTIGIATSVGSLLYLLVVGTITTWSAFHADSYRDILGEMNIGESFAKDVAPIPLDKVRIVDQDLAYRLGDKILGTQPSLGSQATLGEFRIQKVKGEFLWVAPLLHSGIFKWYSNPQGTPGYVIVSATNERDVRLVQEIDGKPLLLRYQPNAFGFDYLNRHIYMNGYMSQGFTDFTFEIDDNGHPYWVVTLFDKEVGFHGNNATGALVVDAITGEMAEYSISEAPVWVDRIQPKSFVQKQLNDWGELVHGWWNPSNKDKLTTTQGMSLVYDQSGGSYWYTGLTSVGSDEGTVGFVLVNTRDKSTTWYKQIGATEQAARVSAMGKVQEKGYVSSFPLTYNINGVPTYVMSLKDQAGLIKMIGMVSVQDYSIVAVGNDLQECARSYKNALNSLGNSISPESVSTRYELRSVIERIASDVRNGQTYYYLTLADYQNKIFIGTSNISPELPITQIKDSVVIKYDDQKPALVDIIRFDNLIISTDITIGEGKIEENQ